MIGLSTVEGFVVINENVGDMIKYVANEPSVGMYFIQQHAQKAVPNLIKLKTKVIEKSHETAVHTEDLEESAAITRSMKEFGFPIVDEMIRDIEATLAVVKEGIIQQQGLSYETSGSSFWVPTTWARGIVAGPNNGEGGGSYFYNMFSRSSEDMAGNQKFAPKSGSVDRSDDTDKLRSCNGIEGEVVGDSNIRTASNEFDEFKADREAKLEEWLKGSGGALEKGTGDRQEQSSA